VKLLKKTFLLLYFAALSYITLGQQQDPSWSTRRTIINEQSITNDSLSSVLHKMGIFEGHVRSFFMGTVNHNSFPDYYAYAIGGGLGYYSPIFNNFQVGLS
jgi:hypothetical protein